MTVRSRLFETHVALTNGIWAVLVAPAAGRTAIVRHWSVYNSTPNAQDVTVGVRKSGVVARVARAQTLASGTAFGEPRANIVVGPGESFEVLLSNTTGTLAIHAVACGSLLLGAPE